MSELPHKEREDEQNPVAWAPHDEIDAKKKGIWRSVYPPEANKRITWESLYLVVMFILSLAGVFYILYKATYETIDPDQQLPESVRNITNNPCMLLGFLGAWVGGTLGGCCFGIKWLYHSVAMEIWIQDRLLWRLLTPHLSGVVALFMVLLISSGLIQIFDKSFAERPIGTVAFGFLVGYFSDKALAKMAEVADTLFGGAKKVK